MFVTSATPDGTSCHVLCLEARDGKLAWDKEVFRQAANRKMAENSHATPTPVTDGKLVFAAFNGGRIVAVDFHGNVAWTWRDDRFVSKHGLAASPILYRDKLIMPFDGNGPADINNIGYRTAWDGAFITALDKRTGKEKWRAKRGLSRQAHVTPMVTLVSGKPQLISGAGDVVQGFDPDSGERLWTVPSPGEGVVPSIVLGPEGLIFTSSGYGSPAIRAIRPGGHGGAAAAHVDWESRGNVPLVPSFLCAGSLLFCVKESGVASCLDAKTGQTIWKERLGGTYGASPVLADGRLYCLAEDGTTTVIAAGREFKHLATNRARRPVQGIACDLRGTNLHPFPRFAVLYSSRNVVVNRNRLYGPVSLGVMVTGSVVTEVLSRTLGISNPLWQLLGNGFHAGLVALADWYAVHVLLHPAPIFMRFWPFKKHSDLITRNRPKLEQNIVRMVQDDLLAPGQDMGPPGTIRGVRPSHCRRARPEMIARVVEFVRSTRCSYRSWTRWTDRTSPPGRTGYYASTWEGIHWEAPWGVGCSSDGRGEHQAAWESLHNGLTSNLNSPRASTSSAR